MEVSGVLKSWATFVISSFFVRSDSRSLSISFRISASILFKFEAMAENSLSPTTSIWVFKSPSEIFWIAIAIFPMYFMFFFSIMKKASAKIPIPMITYKIVVIVLILKICKINRFAYLV